MEWRDGRGGEGRGVWRVEGSRRGEVVTVDREGVEIKAWWMASHYVCSHVSQLQSVRYAYSQLA